MMTTAFEPKKRKLANPLWTHLPALAVLVIFILFLLMSTPIPSWAPVHFGLDGEPDRYGNPWGFVWFIIGFSLFFIALSGFLDEQWARQEKKKSFNWLCWLDDITVGWMGAVGTGYLLFLQDGEYSFTFPWGLTALIAGGALVLSLILEAIRPYRPYAGKPAEKDTQFSTSELARRIKEDTNFVYWDIQNPLWVTLLAIVVPLVLLGSGMLVWFSTGGDVFSYVYMPLSVIIAGFLVAFIYGGQRTIATRYGIVVRWGLAGIKVLNLKTAEVSSVELHEFAPLKDFGGYGIRGNREMTAYYLQGRVGVKITMVNGKKYLVGSDQPERLLTVLQLVAGKN
jgi:hypothetical protein